MKNCVVDSIELTFYFWLLCTHHIFSPGLSLYFSSFLPFFLHSSHKSTYTNQLHIFLPENCNARKNGLGCWEEGESSWNPCSGRDVEWGQLFGEWWGSWTKEGDQIYGQEAFMGKQTALYRPVATSTFVLFKSHFHLNVELLTCPWRPTWMRSRIQRFAEVKGQGRHQ